MKKELLSKGPELLADLGDHTASILREMTDLKEPLAYNIAIELVNKMRHIWGGQLIYFPKGASMEIAERDLQMYADFNQDGKNQNSCPPECALM
ncbi:MAG: DNA-binding protein [Candidatus Thiodiazotropha sp. (ex Dulcina madagascariensis)]|nr:DNA-binding protein [Candidatus Thiodiazotropha sp. (ex Dulcina madagascariensis)]